MTTVSDLARFLDGFAPPRLAEEWDNVGLLVGDASSEVRRVMTCLTVTPASLAEAIAQHAELIVTHHPLPFRPLKRLTTDTPTGRMLWDAIGARLSIYSPHTAFDSAAEGVNQRLAAGLGLEQIRPLLSERVAETGADFSDRLGAGRWGRTASPLTLEELAGRVKQFLSIDHVQIVGGAAAKTDAVAVACGSGGEFLDAARQAGCDCLVTGEARFHTCLEAEATGMSLVIAGHYPTERFAVEQLAGVLANAFPGVHVWASRDERDPLAWC